MAWRWRHGDGVYARTSFFEPVFLLLQPTHFCRNNGGGGGGSASKQHLLLPMGSTLLKRRLLQRRGWAVASVCAADWERLRGAAPKRAFLAAAVEAAEAEADAAAAAAAAAWPLAGG